MKNSNGIILALITAQPSCERIIKIAEDYSIRLGSELIILTAQPHKTTAQNRSKDMVCLTELSKKTGRDIKIIYSDRPLKAVIKETAKLHPKHIFVGQGGQRSEFLTGLRLCAADSPISVVGIDGIVFSLPGISEEIYTANNI